MCRRSVPAKSMRDLLHLDALSKKFVKMCADVFPFKKGHGAGLPYMCCEKIHSMMQHSIRKETARFLGAAIQGSIH